MGTYSVCLSVCLSLSVSVCPSSCLSSLSTPTTSSQVQYPLSFIRGGEGCVFMIYVFASVQAFSLPLSLLLSPSLPPLCLSPPSSLSLSLSVSPPWSSSAGLPLSAAERGCVTSVKARAVLWLERKKKMGRRLRGELNHTFL